MKKLMFVLMFAALLVGCNGKDGVMGPSGLNGSNGSNGSDGSDGKDSLIATDTYTGTTSVTEWISPSFATQHTVSCPAIVNQETQVVVVRILIPGMAGADWGWVDLPFPSPSVALHSYWKQIDYTNHVVILTTTGLTSATDGWPVQYSINVKTFATPTGATAYRAMCASNK